MRKSVCLYCQLPFNAPALACPHCHGPVTNDLPRRPWLTANEDRESHTPIVN